MEIISLLEFLNNAKEVCGLEYHEFCCPVDILDLINEDEQFVKRIDMGVIYYLPKTLDQYTIIYGIDRIISLSLLLHAVCECYKKTSAKNDSAIRTIRSKYLLNNKKSKLRLSSAEQELYDKIINGERLSGREKESKMFTLLHNLWVKIKENKLQASHIFKMLQRIYVVTVESDGIPNRDLYYILHKKSPNLNQLALIKNYLKNIGIVNEWEDILSIFNNNSNDLSSFLKDYFVTKYSFSTYDSDKLYENFVNYFDTMLQYMSEDVLIAKIRRSAALYRDILNINIDNEELKKALIQIKLHDGEDTYAYILSIYEDYIDNNMTESTLLEILSTIDEYLQNRLKSANNVNFNELIQYLNAFIACK